MEFLERDLQEIIYLYPCLKLRQKGLRISGHRFRQLKIGLYGIADLVTVCINHAHENTDPASPEYFIDVFEFKKDMIDPSAFWQAVRYVRGINHFISDKYPYTKVSFRIILIGRRIDLESSFCYLPGVFENVQLVTYNYGIDGITFKYNDYLLTNPKFDK